MGVKFPMPIILHEERARDRESAGANITRELNIDVVDAWRSPWVLRGVLRVGGVGGVARQQPRLGAAGGRAPCASLGVLLFHGILFLAGVGGGDLVGVVGD